MDAVLFISSTVNTGLFGACESDLYFPDPACPAHPCVAEDDPELPIFLPPPPSVRGTGECPLPVLCSAGDAELRTC